MNAPFRFLWIALLVLLVGRTSAQQPKRVLVALLDDVGLDVLDVYTEQSDLPDFPETPNIRVLAAKGLLFKAAWATSWCSSTRGEINTGRWPFRNGIGSQILIGGISLPATEILLPRVLIERVGGPIPCAGCGKWHLSGSTNPATATGPSRGPVGLGYDYWDGTLFPVMEQLYCNPGTWVPWQKFQINQDGTFTGPTDGTQYLVSDQVDAAQTWILAREGEGSSWFCYLAVQAPFERDLIPPVGTFIRAGLAPDYCMPCADPMVNKPPRDCYMATIESVDYELGQLLAALPQPWYDTTTIIFVGDNGTPGDVIDASHFDPDRGKGTIYEGGINVPFIIAGASVIPTLRGTETNELASTVDIFATVADIFGGVTLSSYGVTFDSVSLKLVLDGTATSVREFVYSEQFNNTTSVPVRYGGKRVMRDRAGYKLVREPRPPGQPQLVDKMYLLPDEDTNRGPGFFQSSADQNAYAVLAAQISSLLASN